MVCSAYFPSHSAEIPPPAEFKELVEYCSEKKLELRVGSDANAYHIVWGTSSDVNPRGKTLCEYLMTQGLQVQNKEKAPMIFTRAR